MTGNKLSASPEAMERHASVYTPMGITAENVAKKFNVEREAQDKFALRSQKNGSEAVEKKVFAKEIIPITAYRYVGEEKKAFQFDTDELPRPDTTLEGLASLKPAFATVGSVTAGNSSPLSDGAAAAIVASAEKAKAMGVPGLGYLRAFATVGVDPAIMGIGPVPAIRKLLAKTGMKIDQIDRFEINEAFASQAVYVQRELGIDDKVLNPNGGAIALGHPLGCTGAKLTATLLHGLHRTGGKFGIVSMCIGGGQGAAALFERI
jgi:acetyl-CoA acyltransferase